MATTALARILDLSAIVAIAAVVGTSVSLFAAGQFWVQGVVLPAVVVLAAGGMLFVLRRQRVESLLPSLIRTRASGFLVQLRQISIGRIALAALWTLPSWALEASVLIAVCNVLGVEMSIPAAVAITAFTLLFQIFHITPGGIGVYEGAMAGALYAYGIPFHEALAIAILTHGLKFAYSYTFALAFTLTAVRHVPELNPLNRFRGSSHDVKAASRFEVIAARLWNVLNEGKPFTPVFVVGTLVLLSLPHATDGSYWPKAGIAFLALVPLFLVFYRFDFPLKLRIALWVFLGIFFGVFRFVDPIAASVTLGLYITFTVFLWGSVYYHLRIGTPWTNFTRFWRLVLENPDPTSGNFLEQVPKALLLVMSFQLLVQQPALGTALALEGLFLGIGLVALLAPPVVLHLAPRPLPRPDSLPTFQSETTLPSIHCHRHRRLPGRPPPGSPHTFP